MRDARGGHAAGRRKCLTLRIVEYRLVGSERGIAINTAGDQHSPIREQGSSVRIVRRYQIPGSTPDFLEGIENLASRQIFTEK